MTKKPDRYVVLRRDGVIVRKVGAGNIDFWNAVEFLPRALEGLRMLAANDYGVLLIAEAPCSGKSLFHPQELERLTQRLLLEVALERGRIDKVYYCRRTVGENGHGGVLAKGLLRRALAEHGLCAANTYLISDSVEDLAVAAALGCPGIRIRRDAFLRPSVAEDAGQEVASSLYEAAERIVNRGTVGLNRLVRRSWQQADFANL